MSEEEKEEERAASTFSSSVQTEKSRLLPAQRLWLVGRRSEESQRVPGWSGW